jgi:hypothetical protein
MCHMAGGGQDTDRHTDMHDCTIIVDTGPGAGAY